MKKNSEEDTSSEHCQGGEILGGERQEGGDLARKGGSRGTGQEQQGTNTFGREL